MKIRATREEAGQMAGYIGIAVHGYRSGIGRDEEETVTRVIAIGNHCYDGVQHETAIKAATDKHPRPRWYVGYGSDFIPAGKSDMVNIVVK